MPNVQEAIEAIDRGEIENGLSLLKKSRENADHETLLEIAQIYNELGFIQEASDVAEELIAFYPEVDDLKLFAAELYIEMEQEEEALHLLSSITSENERYLEALVLSADLYERQGLSEVAEQKLLTAKRIAPNEPVITFGLGEFYLHHGNFNRSRIYYEELIKAGHEDFNQTPIHLRMAESLTGSGQFEEALTYYEKGLQEESNPDDWFGYALTANRIGEHQKTIQALNHLKDLDPQYTTLYPTLAQAYEEEGALQEAMEACLEGIRWDEFNDELYLQAGKLAFRLHDQGKGIELLKHAISLNPSNTNAISVLMEQYLQGGMYEAVTDLAGEVERYGDLPPGAIWKTAVAYRELEDDEHALKKYVEAYTELKDQPEFLEDYGWYSLEIGERARAKELFSKTMAIDPDRLHLEEEINRLQDL
ncbi:tetratricopeptide repeat protein [Pseudalkalibacillus salsuginis]|uniref:tetratricopeptide repeat protein n=1 Tax=Pseudalkalibacillus salsuginis TaxID=2910972 RepID=UPI001F316447|nr:tetratricopeptide repeat protein [Pseudalkalibacillus salsuginis]MCF6408225.1 tetratricopeptide repeat protein [Pseudalkalibacillus salsuginis]